jgi:hypothetical protein
VLLPLGEKITRFSHPQKENTKLKGTATTSVVKPCPRRLPNRRSVIQSIDSLFTPSPFIKKKI